MQTDTNKVTHITFSTFIIAGKKEFITVDLTVYLRKKKKLIYQNKRRRMKVLALKLLFTTFIYIYLVIIPL